MNIDLRVVYKELLTKRDEITKDIEAAERLMGLAKRPYKKRAHGRPGPRATCQEVVLKALGDGKQHTIKQLPRETGRLLRSIQGAITGLLKDKKIQRVSKGVYQITGKGA